MKEAIILGGPNRAGKTTTASRLLPKDLGIFEFVNADEIARGLSPFNPEGNAFAAGRLMLDRMRELMRQGESFAFETTCAGRGHLRMLQRCRAVGYRLTLVFLWLPSPQTALERVARRVREGGHFIPPEVIVRRYGVGLRNMRHLYLPLVDVGLIYDNTGRRGALVAQKNSDVEFIVHDHGRWNLIEEATR
jgi:predicted ABC-type ATPase